MLRDAASLAVAVAVGLALLHRSSAPPVSSVARNPSPRPVSAARVRPAPNGPSTTHPPAPADLLTYYLTSATSEMARALALIGSAGSPAHALSVPSPADEASARETIDGVEAVRAGLGLPPVQVVDLRGQTP
jgi:hypothetical protein